MERLVCKIACFDDFENPDGRQFPMLRKAGQRHAARCEDYIYRVIATSVVRVFEFSCVYMHGVMSFVRVALTFR